MYRCAIIFTNVLGFVVSLYSLIIEMEVMKHKDYEASCDLSESVSCTKVFSSQYGSGFGLIKPIFGENSILNQPNSAYGCVYYTLQLIGVLVGNRKFTKVLLYMSYIVLLVCVYLACILIFVLKVACVVCVTIYVTNLMLTIFLYKLLNKTSAKLKRKSD